jgi:subtilisin family serine protease
MRSKSGAIKDALEYARSRKVLVVASAGNDDREAPIQFPTTESSVISVAATNLDDTRAGFSNFNNKVDLVAPGVSILSLYTAQGAGFASWSGTSMAAPFVSGALAIAREALGRGASPARVVGAVLDSAADITLQNPDYIGLLGAGRVDLAALTAELRRITGERSVPLPASLWLVAALLGMGIRQRRSTP